LPFLREKFPHLDMAELGKDTMDVWLDSGVSHWCILQKDKTI
jgi:isoleucyl-tRNA synthetase